MTKTPLKYLALIFIVTFFGLLNACKEAENSKGTSSPFSPNVITLREVPNSPLKELRDDNLAFIDSNGTKWVAPKGTVTDGASVPRLALFMTDGRFAKGFLKAAVIHDAYCQSDNELRSPDQYQTKSWQEVHRMFYDAMIAGGTSRLEAKLMFAAVWIGGPRWDDPGRILDSVSDQHLQAVYAKCVEWMNNQEEELLAKAPSTTSG